MRQKIGPKEAMKILGITRPTLKKYIDNQLVKVVGRTKGGERRFWLDEILATAENDLSHGKEYQTPQERGK